jgi:hypothetical protein
MPVEFFQGFAAVADDIADIKATMATKADVRNIVGEELAPTRAELKSIRLDLDDLKGKSRTSPASASTSNVMRPPYVSLGTRTPALPSS